VALLLPIFSVHLYAKLLLAGGAASTVTRLFRADPTRLVSLVVVTMAWVKLGPDRVQHDENPLPLGNGRAPERADNSSDGN
jgi:hypothetical protein